MKLYHHTSATLLESILDDTLSMGHLTFPDGAIKHGVVWLTSDPLPYHHGLLDGTPLDSDGIAAVEHVQGARPVNPATHDKRQVRITVDSDALGDNCVPFLLWAQAVDPSGTFGASLGLSAIDGVAGMTDEAVIALANAGVSRERTWYLMPQAIHPSQFEAIDAFVNGTYVPYVFEEHGRNSLAHHGLIYPEPALLASLPTVGARVHAFDRLAVFAVAPSASAPPHIRFRGYGADTIVALDEVGTVVATSTEHPYGPIPSEWVRGQRTDMERLWQAAVEVARRYGAL